KTDTFNDADRQRLEELNREIDVLGEWTWLNNVRSKADYKEVPLDILLDLTRANEFAEKYPASWKYRTTRGPAAGKAILPYSDMRTGDMILGEKSNSARAVLVDKEETDNTFDNKKPKAYKANDMFTSFVEEGDEVYWMSNVKDGKFDSKQLKAIDRARERVQAQNYENGQRIQSTSDWRPDYALDYLQMFFEAQALGMKMQTYTKVLEFGDWCGRVGIDCNLSLMGWGFGYARGKLVYSDVTGINHEEAFKLRKKYASVQTILVGFNDEHILMALGNDPNTGSAYVDMVIPNHSSGARAEFTARLTRNIDNTGDSYNSKAIRNYEAVQNNKDTLPKSREFDNTPERQRARTLRMLRQQILTGKSGNKYTALNAEQKQQIAELFLETERERFGNMKDTKGNWLSFDEMRAIELTALGEQDTAVVKGQTINQEEAQRIYNAWSGQVWKSIFDDFDSGEYQGVHLTKTQTNHVATNEFWNKEADREHAYVNGFIFRSYVRRMGYQPMFAYTTTYTEVDADGNEIKGPDGKAVKVTYGDFSKSDGYYKLLIDRRMYDLDGNYREQNVI
ncbi:MAG: hypothetical protein IKG04_08210, partial [Exiguobacterium sp.]|nr:hypothetical protein [Exiguobacterium sp.]